MAARKSKSPVPLRVLLVDASGERAAMMAQALPQAGCQLAAHVASSGDLAGLVAEIKPDVIIMDLDSPDRDTLEHLCLVSRDSPRPVVMFTDDDDSEKIRAAVKAGVSAYVVDGLKPDRVRPIIDVAVARFQEFQAMRDSLSKAETELAARKDIDRAKGILMKQRGLSEDEAYQLLRKMAMDRNQKLGDLARAVVEAAELLG
jgi:response regulator NasT